MRDSSSFWVGPADDPDRYRLTHLLGSGGEGEVWRAVRAGTDVEVAVKIDPVPEGADDGWEHRLRSLSALRVKGLVQVNEAFVGPVRHRIDDDTGATPTHRYVVMNHVDGVTLRSWLDENPRASARRRIKILRGVAATLTRLHRGVDGQESVTHGDVKPANIIIGRDGNPVLVDLGLLRPAGSGPVSGHSAAYSSPELRNPDSSPSPRADTFSFAVTAMETMTALTPPLEVDGTLDLGATRARVAGARGLRLRPVLRRQLLRSLTPEPERRPRTPVRVFAGRAAVIALVPLLVIVGAGGSAIAFRPDDRTPQAAGAASPTPAAPATTIVSPPRAGGPTATRTPKPTPSASPSATTTPSPVTLPDAGRFLSGAFSGGRYVSDPGAACGPRAGDVVAAHSDVGSTWGSATFTLTLVSEHQVRILDVSHDLRPATAPSRLVQNLAVSCTPAVSPPSGTCNGPDHPQPYRTNATYSLDADSDSFDEVLGRDRRPFGVLDFRCAPPTELQLPTNVCAGNYDYTVTLTYQVDGDPGHIYTQTFRPLHLRALVRNATFVTSLGRTSYATKGFSGGPAGCARKGVTRTRPYGSVVREVDELLVKAVRERRAATGLSTTGAIKQVVEDMGTPAPGYDAAGLMALCQRAWNESGWRTTCGRNDTVATTPTPTP